MGKGKGKGSKYRDRDRKKEHAAADGAAEGGNEEGHGSKTWNLRVIASEAFLDRAKPAGWSMPHIFPSTGCRAYTSCAVNNIHQPGSHLVDLARMC